MAGSDVASNIDGIGILASGIVKGNTVISFATGIDATGTVTGNYAASNSGTGFAIGAGSTVIGNTVTGSQNGLLVDCPSNVTDNTAVFNTAANLVLNGAGCSLGPIRAPRVLFRYIDEDVSSASIGL